MLAAKQTVARNNTSEEITMSSVVPQGTVLGPLIFIRWVHKLITLFRYIRCNYFIYQLLVCTKKVLGKRSKISSVGSYLVTLIYREFADKIMFKENQSLQSEWANYFFYERSTYRAYIWNKIWYVQSYRHIKNLK